MTIKSGDLVYVTKLKRKMTDTPFQEVRFKNCGAVLFLKAMPPMSRPLDEAALFRLLGLMGLGKIDDIQEFLGVEAANLFVKKFEEKYYGKVEAGGIPNIDTGVCERPVTEIPAPREEPLSDESNVRELRSQSPVTGITT